MECLISTVNKLQDVIDKTDSKSSTVIQLPQIVVVGSQSSGKSSVLESLVGKPFLPRGDGIVTRCPIVLKLIHTPGTEEWVEFDHKPQVKFNFDEVENEIRSKTHQITGGNTAISREKIKLSVYSPKVLTLTLIDLPGIVKIPLPGQPADIGKQTTDLAKEYTSQQNSIILAVSDASVDIANSESIKLATEVDPFQDRTVAVLTKSDLASHIDIKDLLSGRLLPMKLGMIAVINRSKSDVERNVSIEEVVAREKLHFATLYPELANQHGTPYLAKRLNSILLKHIQNCCPTLDIKVKELLSTRMSDLQELGSSDEELTEFEKLLILTKIINAFAMKFAAQIDGQRRVEIEVKKATAGSRIDFVFDVTLLKDLGMFDPLQSITDDDIIIAIRNASPVGAHQFLPEEAINRLVKNQIMKMKPSVLHCCSLVHQVMNEMIENCIDNKHRFPKANEAIKQSTLAFLEEKEKYSRVLLENYMEVQAASAFTANAEYKKEITTSMANVNSVGLGKLPASFILNGDNDSILATSDGQILPFDSKVKKTKEQEEAFVKVKRLIQMNCEIVRSQVLDYVPKALLYSMIYAASNGINVELMDKLRAPEKADELCVEPQEISDRRASLTQEIDSLQQASQLLGKVKSTTL